MHVFFAEYIFRDLLSVLSAERVVAAYADQGGVFYLAGIRNEAVVACDVEGKAHIDQEGKHDCDDNFQRAAEKGAEVIVVDDLHDAGGNDGKQQHPDD